MFSTPHRAVAATCLFGLTAWAGAAQTLPFTLCSGVPEGDNGLPFVLADDAASDGDELPRRGVAAAYADDLRRTHQEMLARRLAGAPRGGPGAVCFAPGTPDDVVQAFNEHFGLEKQFQNFNRWAGTAYSPGGSLPGKPLTLSYSVVPDGTPIAGFNGEPASPSQLRAQLNAIYGSEAVWLPIIHDAFNRWASVTGITYIYEPSDDGIDLGTAVGVPGVRGDCRIGGHPIDGNSGILAYNFFPEVGGGFGGDMVIDSPDNFYNNTTIDSRRLRNVLQHEHGHGLGMRHVCPIETTKLMEPTVSTAYTGVRHDDARHGQFLYGDAFEPNDLSLEATALGALDSCTTATVGPVPAPDMNFGVSSLAAVDVAGDRDVYSITVDSPRRISVRLTPQGWNGGDSAQACSGQTASCCSGTHFNSIAAANLTLEVLSDGVTVIASSTGAPAGSEEAITDLLLPGVGTFYIRVGENGFTQTQQYHLTVTPRSGALSVALQGTAHLAVNAGTNPAIDATITAGTQTLVSGTLFYTINAGPEASVPLTLLSGSTYRAELPQVLCTDTLTFRMTATGSGGSIVSLPCDGSSYTPVVGVLTTAFSDSFESDLGWTVGPDTATLGNWTRVTPIYTVAQPQYDNTPGAGTQCFVTGQGLLGGAAGTFDLDSGETVITSPVFSLSGQDDAVVSYARWHSNGQGAGAFDDRLRIQVSNNGGASWTAAETVGPGSITDPEVQGGWRSGGFTLSATGLAPTATMRLRVLSEDINAASLIESAFDDVVVTGIACSFTPPVSCYLDYNGDTVVNPDDLGDFITDYYTEPAIPGPGGYAIPCPENDPPYDQGYKAAFNFGNVGSCAPPNPDNLGDFITEYYMQDAICGAP